MSSLIPGSEKDFQANTPESHNLIEQSRLESKGVILDEGTEAFSPHGEKVAYKCLYQLTSVAKNYASREPEAVRETDSFKNYQRASNLHLPPILLKNLMAWVAKFHELRILHPNGLTLNATPEHVRDAANLHPWGVVYDPERYLLLSWGDVPTVTLLGLRDLETGELLIPEQAAA